MQTAHSTRVPTSRRIHGSSAAGQRLDKGRRERRESLIGYFAAVSAMDAAIGRVLDALDAQDSPTARSSSS